MHKYLPIFLLGVICAASLAIKISQTDFAEPVYFDALEYNTYAWNLAHGINDLPVLHNIGFSLLLAPIFTLTPDFNTSSEIQKLVTILISSVITLPLVFKLITRFFDWRFGILGVILMAFEPHIIQNTTFGITEPLYLMLLIISMILVTSKNSRTNLLGFVIAGLAMITRFEGIVLLPLFAGLYLYKKKSILHLGIGVSLFLVIVGVFTFFNISYVTHENVVTAKINHEITVLTQNINAPNDAHHTSIFKKIGIGVLYMGYSTFPVFIWFIPIGLYYLLKHRPVNPYLVFGALILFVIPGLEAYLRAFDTRYFIHVYPLLVLISVYGFYNLEKTWVGKAVTKYIKTKSIEIILSILILAILFPFVPNLSVVSLNEDMLSGDAAGAIPNTVFIYPTYTVSAYDTHGFYTFYKGLCDTHCLTIPDRFNNLDRLKVNVYGLDTIKSMGYKILTDRQVDENPQELSKYDTVVVLHNEYVTQKEFDAITHHPHVIYLYPNALYAMVKRNADNSLTLVRGHNYPAPDIKNGFNWQYDNSKLEYQRDCTNFHFYKIPNGYMLNCYPEDIINSSPTLWEALSKI